MTSHLESATRQYLVQEIERLRARVRELESRRGLDVRDFGAVPEEATFYPEPIWPLYLTKEQIANGVWVRIESGHIKDYRISPFSHEWENRYTADAVQTLKAACLPPIYAKGMP